MKLVDEEQLTLEGGSEEILRTIEDRASVKALPCCRAHFIYSTEDAILEQFSALGIEDLKSNKISGRMGCLDVVTGPMYAGKTFTAIGVAEYTKHVGQGVKVFVHEEEALSNDVSKQQDGGNREEKPKSKLVSLSGSEWEPVYRVGSAAALWEILMEDCLPELVIIDEAQFFDKGIVPVCVRLADKGCDVLVSGLNLNYYEEPFGSIPNLMALADRVYLLNAMCSFDGICDEPATRTIRIKADGYPAAYREFPTVDPGGKEMGYEPRCRKHHIVPNHPSYTSIKLRLLL